jgi:RimJ/RimL family protein N-acetyltransferase
VIVTAPSWQSVVDRLQRASRMVDDQPMAQVSDIAALSWPKRTERLTLRPVEQDDFEALWQIRRQEPVGRWMTSASTDRERFLEVMADADRMAKTLVIERDGTVIGDLMLAPEDAWAQEEVADRAKGVQAEIGWCLDPAAGGDGLATEAVRELIRIAFEDLGLRRLVANAFAANEPSRRLMERVGMREEAHLIKESLHRSGEWMDAISYGLLATEWVARVRGPAS